MRLTLKTFAVGMAFVLSTCIPVASAFAQDDSRNQAGAVAQETALELGVSASSPDLVDGIDAIGRADDAPSAHGEASADVETSINDETAADSEVQSDPSGADGISGSVDSGVLSDAFVSEDASDSVDSGISSNNDEATTATMQDDPTSEESDASFDGRSTGDSGWVSDGKHWHYLDSEGVAQTGWQYIDGAWYWLADDGAMRTGWESIGGKWYWFDRSGAMATGIVQIGAETYWLGADGSMCTGWTQIEGEWCYFTIERGNMAIDWTSDTRNWYYFDDAGIMQTDWESVDDYWYWLADDGAMRTGWESIDGQWYHFASSGDMHAGWQSIGGHWYLLNAAHDGSYGAMLTGWQLDGGKWYYLDDSGRMLKNCWVGGYYLQKDGSMADGSSFQGAWRSGVASAYGSVSDGTLGGITCIGDIVTGNSMGVAIPMAWPNCYSYMGKAVEISYGGKTVIAKVNDVGGMGGGSRHLDLQPGVWKAFGATSCENWGLRTVSYRFL